MPEYLIPKRPPREGRAGVRKRLEKALSDVRDTDREGGAAIVDHDDELLSLLASWPEDVPPPEVEPEDLWEDIKARFQWMAARGPCLRCGTCCRRGSPTLYEGDLELVVRGVVPRSVLFTLRRGERAYSPRLQEAAPVEDELIKVREPKDGRCAFLESSLCTIHGDHPLQCRHLECWTGKHAGDLSSQPRLARRAIYGEDETALALIDEYEEKVPAAAFAADLQAALEGDAEAAARALATIDLDERLRAGIEARYGYDRDEQALLLGREALLVAHSFGIVVAMDESGEPRLAASAARAKPSDSE